MTVPGCANPLLMYGDAGGYQIERSLRFNSSDSASLSRTPASAGNRRTWTWAGWVKRSRTGVSNTEVLFQGGPGAGGSDSNYYLIRFDGSDRLDASSWNGAAKKLTTQVFRDLSAWYHIVFTFDSTQATAANRQRFYVNGVEVTTFTTDSAPTQNTDYGINAAVAHNIGREEYAGGTSNAHFSGYLADVHFIDGQALTPSSFTEVSATTGQLIPKAYTGTFTGNSFWLKFSDNSSTTSGSNVGIGKDFSGLGNYWNSTNLSVTAGAGNDSLVDTPTSYGTDTYVGGEVRGNYATWNPLGTAGPASSNGNLDIASSSTAGNKIGTILLTSGKWYWECVGDGYAGAVVGVGGEGFTDSLSSSGSKGIGYWFGGGIYWDGGNFTSGVASYTTSDVIGIAVDMTAGTVAFYKNNSLVYTATFGSGTVPNLSSGVYPGFNTGNPGGSARTVVANFGQRAFAHPAPSGFKALCDTNLGPPLIAKPNQHFDIITYPGNGSTQTIPNATSTPATALDFGGVGQIGFSWIKQRSDPSTSHAIYDARRGVQARLESDTTDQEATSDNGVTAFNAGTIALGSQAQANSSSETYVAWCWATAAQDSSSHTQGSITSSVRANASAGFSVVTFTAQSSGNATIGHGLGAEPHFIIVKSRAQAYSWLVYHKNLTSNAYYLILNSTAAQDNSSNAWNSTTPTSTVFTLGSTYDGGGNSVAYCFAPVAGYSSFGSYTGNGSADGPFVYTGHRSRWIMLKRTDTTGGWVLIDTARSTSNLVVTYLYADLSSAESTFDLLDITSNGFKLRNTFSYWNASGGTYVYAAFAENPFQYARAR